jgi:hypothetical protein
MQSLKLTQLEGYSVYVGKIKNKEKLVVKTGKENRHYTLDLGMKSKIFDIHETDEVKKLQGTRPEVLFASRHFTIGRVLLYLKNTILPIFQQNIETIDKNWLKTNNCELFGLDNINQDKFFKEKNNEFSVLPKIELSVFEECRACHCCVNEHPSQSFIVYEKKIMVGILLKIEGAIEHNQYLYFNIERFKELLLDLKPRVESYFKGEFSEDKQIILKRELDLFIDSLRPNKKSK